MTEPIPDTARWWFPVCDPPRAAEQAHLRHTLKQLDRPIMPAAPRYATDKDGQPITFTGLNRHARRSLRHQGK